MKKLRFLLTTIAALLCSVTIYAYDFKVNDFYYTITDNEKLTVSITDAYHRQDSDLKIEIPETVTYKNKTYTVTAIGDAAFGSYTYLKRVTIPNSVTSIGKRAFSNCYYLISVTIGNRVTDIGEWAFYNCLNLESISIPNSVTSIGENAFYSCDKLTTLTIGKKVTSIGDDAFSSSQLTSVKVKNRIPIRFTHENIFYTNYIKNSTLYVPIGCKEAYEHLAEWHDFKKIVEYDVEEEIEFKDINTQELCITNWDSNGDGELSKSEAATVTDLGEVFKLDSTITSFDELKYFTGLESISNNAFYGCSGLTSIIIPNQITTIGDSAFYGCLDLKSISIPNNVKSIGDFTFCECSNLTSVKIDKAIPICITNSSTFSNRANATLYVPNGSKTAYETAETWKEFKEIIEIKAEELIRINQYGSNTYCSPYALDFTNVKGLKAYVAGGYNTETQKVLMVNVKTTKPNTGLLLKGEPGDYAVPLLEDSKDNYLNLLVGTNSEIVINDLSTDNKYYNYKYTITSEDSIPKFHKFKYGSTLSSNKAYLQIPVEWFNEPSEAKYINIVFDDESTTDINEFKYLNSLDDEKYPIVYDLQGRRVANPTKGLYIVRGKKVFVR